MNFIYVSNFLTSIIGIIVFHPLKLKNIVFNGLELILLI